MRAEADGLPAVGPTAEELGARPATDLAVGADGMVQPRSGGMSVSADPMKIVPARRPRSLGGTSNLPMFRIEADHLNTGQLAERQVGRPHHFVVEPRFPVALTTYQTDLAATRESWVIHAD
jgi:hypothetical protein